MSVATMITLAGCSGDNNPAGSGDGGDGSGGGNEISKGDGNGGGGATVEFWSSPNQQELSFHKSAAKEFSAESDVNIEVSPVPEGDSSEQVVLTSLASGTEPDVFANVFPGFAAQLQANNAATDLYELDGVKDFFTQRCGEELLSRYEAPGGGLYQAPWKANPVLFQYNDTVFEEAGYSQGDYPRTLSALVEDGPKIIENSGAEVLWDRAPLPTWYQRWFDFIPIYLASSKGEESMFVQKDGQTTPAFNNDTAVRTLEFFQQLYTNDLIPQQSGKEPKFPKDKAAISTGGPWVIPYYTKVNPDIAMSHLTPPVPDGVEPNGNTYADPKNTSIFQSSEVAQSAYSFIEFEMHEKWDLQFMKKTLQLPLRKGLVDSASTFFEENPQVEPYAQALETSHPPAYTPEYSKVMNIFGEEAFVPVTRGNRDPQEGLDSAEKQIKNALK